MPPSVLPSPVAGAQPDTAYRPALGKDPDTILDDAMRKVAKQWLETLEAAVQ